MSDSTTSPPRREISIGFLLVPLQALDMIGPMDILSNINHPYVSMILPHATPNYFSFTAETLLPTCPTMTFHHIGPTMSPIASSANCHLQPSTTIADCPKLDYLLIGGPAPQYFGNLPEDMRAFIVERSKEVKAIFTTCTGAFVLAATGLLDGLPATANHFCVPPMGEKMFPGVKWQTDRNWVVVKPGDEGVEKGGVVPNCEYWTAAGAGAGMDMIAAWIREEFGEEIGGNLLGYSTSLLEWRPSDVHGKPLAYVNGRGELAAVS